MINEFRNLAITAAIKAGIATLDYYRSNFDIELKKDNSPLTNADLASNKIIVDALKKTELPIISEEIENHSFETRKTWDQLWMIDPLDGTKEFINKGTDYTINIGFIENSRPTFGVVYAPVHDTLYWGIVGVGAYRLKNASLKNNMDEVLRNAESLNYIYKGGKLRVVASKSHLNQETKDYLDEVSKHFGEVEICSYGSSLKICMLAEGSAHIYPRLGPTMEWDTAAADAVLHASGGELYRQPDGENMVYNKEDLLNPWFIAYAKGVERFNT